MIPDHLAWLAMGATVALTLCSWPWHPRFRPYSRRGSNPPPPGRKPAPPAGPPQCDWLDEAFPVPPPDVMAAINRQLDRAIAAEMARRAVQRGQGNGGPSTEKPAIVTKPQPHGGKLLKPWE